jgi:hypothetical protein
MGPDAAGLGPDGTPWDPERKRKRDEERAARGPASTPTMNSGAATTVAPGDGDAAPAAAEE